MGFFQGATWLYYAALIFFIVGSVKGIFQLFGWMAGLSALNQAKRAIREGKGGNLNWDLSK